LSGDNGADRVVADAVAGAGAEIAATRAAAAGEQAELLELPSADPERHAGELARAMTAHRRGRPPGAVNRSTKELREYLLRRGLNPLQAMMQWAMHSPESLARELSCTRLEAFDRLASLWRELAPYFASKMVPVDDTGRPVPLMLMQFGAFGAPKEAGGQAPWLYLDAEQNQALSDAAPIVSHGDVSHGTEKSP